MGDVRRRKPLQVVRDVDGGAGFCHRRFEPLAADNSRNPGACSVVQGCRLTVVDKCSASGCLYVSLYLTDLLSTSLSLSLSLSLTISLVLFVSLSLRRPLTPFLSCSLFSYVPCLSHFFLPCLT